MPNEPNAEEAPRPGILQMLEAARGQNSDVDQDPDQPTEESEQDTKADDPSASLQARLDALETNLKVEKELREKAEKDHQHAVSKMHEATQKLAALTKPDDSSSKAKQWDSLIARSINEYDPENPDSISPVELLSKLTDHRATSIVDTRVNEIVEKKVMPLFDKLMSLSGLSDPAHVRTAEAKNLADNFESAYAMPLANKEEVIRLTAEIAGQNAVTNAHFSEALKRLSKAKPARQAPQSSAPRNGGQPPPRSKSQTRPIHRSRMGPEDF